MFSRQYITKSNMTESDFTIGHLMLLFTAYHYWLRVCHQITDDLFLLHDELHSLKGHLKWKTDLSLNERLVVIMYTGIGSILLSHLV